MLTIHYGDMENVIYNTSVYFDNVYSPQWFQDAFSQRIIKSIDKGSVVGPCTIDTKILGIIPPRKAIGRHQDAVTHVLHAPKRIQRHNLLR